DPVEVLGLRDGLLGAVREPGIDLDAHTAVDAVGRGVHTGEEIGGAAHVVGGEHLDDRVDVLALTGEAGDVRVVLRTPGDRGLEDRGVGRHTDDVAGVDELL